MAFFADHFSGAGRVVSPLCECDGLSVDRNDLWYGFDADFSTLFILTLTFEGQGHRSKFFFITGGINLYFWIWSCVNLLGAASCAFWMTKGSSKPITQHLHSLKRCLVCRAICVEVVGATSSDDFVGSLITVEFFVSSCGTDLIRNRTMTASFKNSIADESQTICNGWQFGVVVASFVAWTKLLYTEPGSTGIVFRWL